MYWEFIWYHMMCDFYIPLLTKKEIGNISKILGKVRTRHYCTETQGDELIRHIKYFSF